MDINLLFKSATMSCGRVLNILPEKEIGSPKQYLQTVLETKTMPSLNELYPYIKRIQMRTAGMEVLHGVDPLYVGYRIPTELTNGLKIQSIKACYSGMNGNPADGIYDGAGVGRVGRGMRLTAYPNKYGRYSSANLYETATLAQLTYADNMLLGAIQEAPIPRFQPPNIMWINRSYGTAPLFTLVLCLENDKNLITIPDTVFEGVRRLFILDVKSAIYNEYGMLSNIDTALGNLDIKIDDWSNTEADRNELFDTYKGLAHLRTHSIING